MGGISKTSGKFKTFNSIDRNSGPKGGVCIVQHFYIDSGCSVEC